MKLEINVEQLRKCKLFVATPMYGGMNHGMYAKSCLDLQSMCNQHGIEVRFSFIFNESLITRARNYLVDEYLRSGFTHMLFLDSDIHFDPRDVIAMLALDRDVIGAPYPKKSIKWSAVLDAVKRNIEKRNADPSVPEISAGELEKVTGDYVFNAVAGTGQFNVGDPLEVLELGTGFMMVRREVFGKLAEAFPSIHYKPDHVGQANFDGTRYIHAYFDTVIDSKDSITGGGSDRYLSEDYMFCQMWRKIGGQIWLCPWMKTHHIGTYAFHGDMAAVANHVGTL
ncbi:hypothetical protein UFOVP49_179 [uncultured Caudovirales phage]|uniref:Anp1 n=1 Tax=uncultured Caudovirales phage TaxID=2100421 RepID=A0A6J5KR39_9CAUD|nr:hypothetical protein UFOVP49_179 [uncultured Caudovirales phage]